MYFHIEGGAWPGQWYLPEICGCPSKLNLSGAFRGRNNQSQNPHSNVANCATLEWGTLGTGRRDSSFTVYNPS
jgi:hypothetical protein